MTEYDEITRVSAGELPGEYGGAFTEDWMIGNAVNGGVVMATALTALGQALSDAADEPAHVDPVVLSGYFFTAATPGPVRLQTEVLRQGRSLSTGEVTLSQEVEGEQVRRMRAMASFGDLSGVELTRSRPMPQLPPPAQCLSADDAPPEFLTHSRFLERMDLRVDPRTATWAMGKPTGVGVIRGWLRLRDHREPDTTMLFLAMDAFPPVAFDLGLYGWTPTLEFTGHVRRRPAPGWLAIELSTENLGGGFLEEDAVLWDSTGALVAQSRQLCGVREPGRS